MRLDPCFQAFMRDTVNINKGRLEILERSVESIYTAIVEDPVFGPRVIDKDPQGSWAHRTIIKPVSGREFDADFMLILQEDSEWSRHPATYIDELHACLSRSTTYKSKLAAPKCRCVRVVYGGDYHVDIVPFVVLGSGRQVIVNHDEDEWEDTNPAGFTRWLADKDGIARGHLREVIRLLKYLRDHGGHFVRTRSVLLTAMLGERVDAANLDGDPGYYEDLPTAFYHVITDLNDWLCANGTKPSILDPSGARDPSGRRLTFDHRWTSPDYLNFRTKIKGIAADVRAAYLSTDEAESLELWQKVFGSEFKQPATAIGPLGGAGGAAANVPSVQSGRSG